MPTFEIDGARYHYTVQGEGESLLLLHGFTGSGVNWGHHLPGLAAYFRVITVDLPGHGQTILTPDEPARYAMPLVARDLAALVEALSPPIHLLGYSMGGRLALYLALHDPHLIQRLTLESASPGLATAPEREQRITQDEALAQRLERDGIPAFIAYWESIPLFASQQALPPEVRQRLRDQRLHNSIIGLANSLHGMGTGMQPSLWDQLSTLNIPTQLIAGDLDSKFVAIAQQMAAQLPHATLAVIEGAGHTVHLERPTLFRDLVVKFHLSAN